MAILREAEKSAPQNIRATVKEWVEANKESITLFHLPSYRPERNPDEYLNGDLKSELGRRAPPMDQNHLEKNLIGSMRRLSKSPQRVASYFEHPAVAHAKAAGVLLVDLPE